MRWRWNVSLVAIGRDACPSLSSEGASSLIRKSGGKSNRKRGGNFAEESVMQIPRCYRNSCLNSGKIHIFLSGCGTMSHVHYPLYVHMDNSFFLWILEKISNLFTQLHLFTSFILFYFNLIFLLRPCLIISRSLYRMRYNERDIILMWCQYSLSPIIC